MTNIARHNQGQGATAPRDMATHLYECCDQRGFERSQLCAFRLPSKSESCFNTHTDTETRPHARSDVRTVAAVLLTEHVYSSETKQCMKTKIKITDPGISAINIEVLRRFLTYSHCQKGFKHFLCRFSTVLLQRINRT